MTGSDADLMIAADLAALADDNRREPRTLAETLRPAGAYRDDRLGVKARRDELAQLRQLELATLPLQLAHVFAHRVARAAAGAVAAVAVLGLLLALDLARGQRLFRVHGQGISLGTSLALIAVAVLAAHVVATWLAEAAFARRMRAAIAAGGDPHADLDRLAEGPIERARELVRRADAWAVALGIAGGGAIALLGGAVALLAIAMAAQPAAWPRAGSLLWGPLGPLAPPLVVAIAAITVVAIAVGRTARRAHRPGAARLMRWFAHGGAGLISALLVAGVAARALWIVRFTDLTRALPSRHLRHELVLVGALGVLGAVTWLVLRLRRREDARLDG
jgi:hypothetical protein